MAKVLAGVKLDPETYNEIKEIATKKRRTISDLIRIVLEDFVKQQNL